MNTWNCIDGTDEATWEYTPLGIFEDLKGLSGMINAALPCAARDDSMWTSLISGRTATAVITEMPIRTVTKVA